MKMYPLYVAYCVIWTVVQVLYAKSGSAVKELFVKLCLSAPMEFGLIQSVFVGSFKFLHNGGTWFMSCLFISYIFYPYIAQIVRSNSVRGNAVLCIMLYLISSYAFFPAYRYKFSQIYANPLLRLLEFSIGIIAANHFLLHREKKINCIFGALALVFSALLLFLGLSFGAKFMKWPIETYNFLAIPSFAAILYFCARLETQFPIECLKRTIRVLSENTYAFYFSQGFSWLPAKYLMAHTDFFAVHGSLKKLAVSAAWTVLVTAVLHYGIERPVGRIIKKFQKKEVNHAARIFDAAGFGDCASVQP